MSELLHLSRNELLKHVLSVHGLAPGDHMACIPHDKHAKVLDRLEVSSHLAITAIEDVPVSLVVLINGRPGVHGSKHLQDATVVADDVKVSVVNQDLVSVQEELNIFPLGSHEIIKHGLVDILVAEATVANMNSLPSLVSLYKCGVIVFFGTAIALCDLVVIPAAHGVQEHVKLVAPSLLHGQHGLHRNNDDFL